MFGSKKGASIATITKEVNVADTARVRPGTMKVFTRYNLDFCCGGAYPGYFVAQKHGLELERILRELNEIAEGNSAKIKTAETGMRERQ